MNRLRVHAVTFQPGTGELRRVVGLLAGLDAQANHGPLAFGHLPSQPSLGIHFPGQVEHVLGSYGVRVGRIGKHGHITIEVAIRFLELRPALGV